jgi:hypothetical protein
MGRASVDYHCLPESNNNSAVQGVRNTGTDTFLGTLFQLAVSPFNWIDAAMEDVGMKVGQMMETGAAREPEEKEPEKRSMEDLRKKYSWWPSSHGKEGSSDPLQSSGAEAEDSASLRLGKSTKV